MKRAIYHCPKCRIRKQMPIDKKTLGFYYPFIEDSFICGQCGSKVLVEIPEEPKDET